ncbi:unnamed protein product [Dracunculus medinensis]|uniref:DUF3456 domain-containing protein n=1 Tax=Dracunculus medinensis TaxID=318479 RepID=A0A0N4U1H6_DRAME|nr:unnamed protein product [Dracunculus medinensis]
MTEEKPAAKFLLCNEEIGRCPSPELFPEKIPGVWDLNRTMTSYLTEEKQIRFRTELDPKDVRLVNDLGQLSPDQLMEYVKKLQNIAYTVGLEEGLFLLSF